MPLNSQNTSCGTQFNIGAWRINLTSASDSVINKMGHCYCYTNNGVSEITSCISDTAYLIIS